MRRNFVFLFVLGVFCWSLFAEDLFAGPGMRHGWRHGRYHDQHHSLGHVGRGICPQMRVTARAPDDIFNLKNPLEPSQENLMAGESIFQVDAQPTACKICHSATGNGMGMMAPGMNPPPRNFRCAETMKTIPDGQLFWIIKNGSPGTGMPAYQSLKDEQVWQLVLYLRRMSE